jgi:hypothetical protein
VGFHSPPWLKATLFVPLLLYTFEGNLSKLLTLIRAMGNETKIECEVRDWGKKIEKVVLDA